MEENKLKLVTDDQTTPEAVEPAPVTAPDAPQAEPAIDVAPAQPEKILFKSDCHIHWLNDDGTIESSDTCLRGTVAILQFIGNKLQADPDKSDAVLNRKVRIVIKAEAGQPKDGNGKEYEAVLGEGTCREVVTTLMRKSVPPQLVINEMQTLCSFMSERSALKGVIVTAVFGDAEAGGFGMLSTVTKVSDADIVTLAEAAANQAQLFKDEMKKRNPTLRFKDDSGLILPTRFQK